MTSNYERAIKALEQAQLAVGVWADEVREEAEERLGIGPSDVQAHQDPQYSEALGVFGLVSDARKRMDATRKEGRR